MEVILTIAFFVVVYYFGIVKSHETNQLKEKIRFNNKSHVSNFRIANPKFFINYPENNANLQRLDGYIQYQTKDGGKVLHLFSNYAVDGVSVIRDLRSKNIKYKISSNVSGGIKNLLKNPAHPFQD
jgi:hypothetical protein